MFDGIHEDRGQPTLKAFIGQISCGRDLLGPDGMGESHGSLHSCILKKLTRSHNHPSLTNGEAPEKFLKDVSKDQPLRRGGSGGFLRERPSSVCKPFVQRSRRSRLIRGNWECSATPEVSGVTGPL